MKNYLLVTLPIAMIISVSMGFNAGATEPYRIQLDACGLDVPVLFEDQRLTAGVKETVVEDYKLIHGHFKEYLFRPYDSGEVVIGDKKFKLSYAVNFKQGYRIRPDGYDFSTIAVVPDTQEKYLFISKHLSDGYQEALALKAKNTVAFDKLEEFIAFMNNLDEEPEISDTEDVVYLSQEAEKYRDIFERRTVSEFTDAYKQYKYKKLSLLAIKRVSETPEELKGMLVAHIVMLDKNKNDEFVDTPLLVYHDNKWKMFMIIHGT